MTALDFREVGRGAGLDPATIRRVTLSPEEVGARIGQARGDMRPKPWSQLDLAIAMGVSPSTIYRWERGRLPSLNELLRLSDVLGKPADYFTELPQRRFELADVGEALAEILALLQAQRVEAEHTREAVLEILASNNVRLVQIEQSLTARVEPPQANQS